MIKHLWSQSDYPILNGLQTITKFQQYHEAAILFFLNVMCYRHFLDIRKTKNPITPGLNLVFDFKQLS